MQFAWPLFGLKVPLGQAVQFAEPAAEYVPGLHARQLDAVVADVFGPYVPAGQEVQLIRPVC